jgi:hypothetical protein
MATTWKRTVPGKNAPKTFKKVKKLNEAALKMVDENATKIAQSLLKSTVDGHVLSARLLVELAEGDIEPEEAMAMRPLRSMALELAAQPPWKPESEKQETGAPAKPA